jgi:hypothetical protein
MSNEIYSMMMQCKQDETKSRMEILDRINDIHPILSKLESHLEVNNQLLDEHMKRTKQLEVRMDVVEKPIKWFGDGIRWTGKVIKWVGIPIGVILSIIELYKS